MSISTKSTNINTNSIEAIVPTSDTITIGADQTSGILNIGGGKNLRTTGAINIGTDQLFGQNNGFINIGHTAASPVINFNGTYNSARAFIVYNESTFLDTITLTTSASLPGNGMLGNRVTATLLTTTPVNGSTYGTLNIITAGMYIFQFNLYQTASTKGTTNYVTFSGATGSNVNTTRYGATSVDGNNFCFSGSQTVRAVIGGYPLTFTTGTIGTTVTTCSGAVSGYIMATRIA